MLDLLALALLQLATLLGSPNAATAAAPKPATETNSATSTTTPAPKPVSTIGNTGWDND